MYLVCYNAYKYLMKFLKVETEKKQVEKIKGIIFNEKVEVAFIMLFCFLFHIAVLNQFDCWFSTDTDGYWLHAASMVGYRWGDVASNMNSFYSWGYSVLLTIPMLLTRDVNVMYKIAIIINVVLCTLLVPIIYSLSVKLAPKLERKSHLFIALIVSCYSTYILESAVSLSETLIYFLTFLILYLLNRFFDTRKLIWGILAGFSVGYIYIVHNRCIGIVVAYIIMVVMYLWMEKDLKTAIILLMPLGGMLLLKYAVTNWLGVVEQTNGVYTSNTYGAMVTKTSKITFYSILSMIQNILGEFWYTIAGTFMIAGFGVLEIIKYRIVPGWKKDRKVLFYVYAITSWVFLIGVSSLFLFKKAAITSGRMDTIIYGRYMESSVGFLILMGLIYLEQRLGENERKKEIGLVIIVSILLSILTHYFVTAYEPAGINWFSVVAVLMPFSYGNTNVSVCASSIVLLSIGLFVIYLFLMKEKIYRWIAYICVCGAFLYIGYNATYTVARIYAETASVENNPTYNADFTAICNYIDENNYDEFYVLSGSGYDAFSYQFVMNDKKVISLIDESELQYLEGEAIIVIGETLDTTNLQVKVLYDGTAYNLIQLEN